MALIKCPECGKEVSSAAGSCPNCGHPISGEKKETVVVKEKKKGGCLKTVFVVFAFIVIIAAIAGSSDSDKPKQVGTIENETQAEEKEFFSVGEIAEYKNVQTCVKSYKESTGSMYLAPADGNVFVAIEFEITNNTTNEMTISSILNFSAYYDDYEADYSITGQTAIGGFTLDGTIASGKKMVGYYVIEAPKDWKTVEFHFKNDILTSKNVKFLIEK